MHRVLAKGNNKLVLILFLPLGPSDLGPGLRLLQQILPSSGDVHRTPSYGSAPTPRAIGPHVVYLAYINKVQ